MDYYKEIKNKIIDNETYERVKDYSKERHRVITYYEIGKLLNEAGKKYGVNIIKQYSEKLVIEVGTKYNERTLRRMRQLYLLFKKQKWSPVATKLSWSHYSEVLSIKDEDKLMYYINACISKNLSKMELRDKIKSKEYERLPAETKNKIIETKVISGHGTNDESDFETTDKVYLLSTKEVYNSDWTTAKDKQRQLDYYSLKNVSGSTNKEYVVKKYNGENTSWWLRTKYSG